MTDLPRYHKGGLGPVDFQTLNEAFRRLDALRPLIETAGIKQEGGKFSPSITVVDAAPIPEEELPEGVPANTTLFAWREVLVRGEETEEPNTLVNTNDDDFQEIDTRSQYRSGPTDPDKDKDEKDPVLPTGYGVSIDENFQGGVCILVDYTRSDTTRVHLLCPLAPSTRTFLALVVGTTSEPANFDVNQCEKKILGDGSTIKATAYTCFPLQAYQDGSSTKPKFCKKGPIVVYDFSSSNVNEPSEGGEGEPTYEELFLQEGNVIPVHAGTFGPGLVFHFTGWLPRLNVICPEKEGAVRRTALRVYR